MKPDLDQRWPKSPTIFYYAMAVLSVVGAIVAAELTARLLHAEAIVSTMLCAVIFAAWFGGFGPALLTIILALLAFHYYLMQPINSFSWKHDLFALDISEVSRLILFFITSLFVAFMIAAQRRATETLRRSRDDLQVAIEDQKRIEAALSHSEMYLSEAQRLSATGSFAWNVSSGEIIWSDQTYRIFGCDRTTKPTVEFIARRAHPEDRAAVRETIERASIDRNDYDHEFRLLLPDSSVKYVHAVAHAVRGASGSTEFVGAVTDVTVAREAERKLRRSEAYLAETQHLSHTSSWAWDVRRQEFVYRSAEVFHLFGLDAEKAAVSEQTFRDRILPEDRRRVIKAAQQAVAEKAHFKVDFRIALPDGSIKRVHSVGHPVADSDGEVTELIGTHVDVTEQYAAEQALQKAYDEIKRSEDRLRLVIDTIPTLVWRAGPEGNPDFLNQPALDYTGLSLEQAETGWPRAFHPDDKKGMLVKWSAIRESGMRGGLEARLRRFDGEYRWFLFEAEPLRDEAGNIVKWYGSSTDIEDRKRAEEALRESEQRWRAVFENNPTMYFMLDASSTIVSVNPFGAEQLGYAVEELVGHPVLNVFHEADRERVRSNVAICFEQLGRTMSWESRKLRKDGRMLWVRETARAMRFKQSPVVLIVCEDITERKRAEYLTRQVFESSPDSVSIIGPDYRYQRVNPTYERRWGMLAETIVGMHLADLVGMDAFEQTAKVHLDRCFAGEEVSYAMWFTFTYGRRYMAVTYSPLRPTSERVEAALAISRDLTEHVVASEGLRQAQAELAHVTRVTTLGELTASISHEVNQPLAAVIANAGACLRWLDCEPPDLNAARRSVEWVISDGNRASEVIRRVRALANKTDTEKVPLDVNDVVGEVIELVQRELISHRVSLRTELAPAPPKILGDRVQLQQVIINLVMNGIEAMEQVTDRPRELVIRSCRDERDGMLLSVTDCGVGISDDDSGPLFKAFFTTKSGGMGMGLSICRSIVEAHGGRLSASRNQGSGATFQFVLPLHHEDAS